MPELPEVETITCQLRAKMMGQIIKDIHIHWNRSIRGNRDDFHKNLIGSTIQSLQRRGKYICFFLNHHRHLTIHLGMSGRLQFTLDERERKHLRIQFVMESGDSLYFHDIRKFGKARFWPAGESLLPELGPEPLDAQRVQHTLLSHKTRRPVKSVLLDQTILAGIGNIYADEALFRAGIHPRQSFASLDADAVKRLGAVIPEILQQAIENRGTTISDYRPPDQIQGSHQEFLKVYGREGRICHNCGERIERIRINNRSSHFCPRCQVK
jgi:formamidopyrimidine-DNA glycosylase